MKNLHIVITFVVTTFFAFWASGCGGDNEDTAGSPTKPKSTTTTQQQPPAGEQPPDAGKPKLPKGIVFFEAEGFDKAKSTSEKGGVKWEVKDDPKAMGGK